AGVAIKSRRAQRNQVPRGVAANIGLRRARPAARLRVSGAEHGEIAAESLPAQHLGGRKSRRAAAHDDDVLRLARRPAALGLRLDLLAHERLAVALFYLPARHGAQRRRAERLAGAQAEAGMVPGATHGVADHEAFGERPAAM